MCRKHGLRHLLKNQPRDFVLFTGLKRSASNFKAQFVQHDSRDTTENRSFSKSHSAKSLHDLTVKCDMSKFTLVARSEQSGHILNNVVFWDVALCRSCVNRFSEERIASIFRAKVKR
jgi:hypothetical protein